MKTFIVESEVHKQLLNGSYRVKVKILNPDLAMYINGMIVYAPSDKYPDWMVYTPKVFNARIVEFAGKSILWQEIRAACIDAVKLCQSYERTDDSSADLAQYKDLGGKELNKQLLGDIDKIFPDAN